MNKYKSAFKLESPNQEVVTVAFGHLCTVLNENPMNCRGCPMFERATGNKTCSDFALTCPALFHSITGFRVIAVQEDDGGPLEESAAAEPLGPTGFVRDAHAGKGRMDLLPWIGIMEVSKLCEEGAEHYGERNIDKGAPLHSLLDSGARHLAKVMSGYTDEDHLRAACWNLLWALQERTTHPELNDTPWPWYGKKEEAAKNE